MVPAARYTSRVTRLLMLKAHEWVCDLVTRGLPHQLLLQFLFKSLSTKSQHFANMFWVLHTITVSDYQTSRFICSKDVLVSTWARDNRVQWMETGSWLRHCCTHNEEPRNLLYASANIITAIKLRRVRWAWHVARMTDMRNSCSILLEAWMGETNRMT
jgi:hypothetical protein